MRLLSTEALTETEGEILCNWKATPSAIICVLKRSLQARNWEGKHIWTVDIERCGPAGLSVASGSVFIGNPGAIQEFDIVSG